MSDTRVQLRAPLARKEGSLMLNNTYAGAGMGARVTPAFTEVGPRLSFAPVDLFDLEVFASRVQYYSDSYALMGFREASGKLDRERSARAEAGDGVTSGGWSVEATPTLKLKFGPLIAFDSFTVKYWNVEQADQAPFTYEPWRDAVVAWTDVGMDNEAALLFAPIDDNGSKLYFGGWYRHRWSANAPDQSIAAGPAVITHIGKSKAVPTALVRSMFYVVDSDRVGLSPNIQASLIWAFDGD